ncbi:unnamed protein product [Caenorhabditis bovis]|uniref:Ig-like domain-containing protein n=1 Tax=Caenorhabditis bovis TaxID=2654633 RepID=A0A8S1F0A5_9PELO|nr:unnamed protein product [Caenorhabditis bovis]
MRRLRRQLMLVVVIVQFSASIHHTTTPKKAPSERLVPLGSTTAFMCDVCITEPEKSASTWFKNAIPVANVSSHANAIYMDRNQSKGYEEKMPQVGFLTIFNVSKEDEGTYWCRRNHDMKFGEVYQLKIAYVDDISESSPIRLRPYTPYLGRPLIAECPMPNAFPPPKVSWSINSLPLSHISSDFSSFSNGTLIIHHFSYHHIGLVECHVSNFAGRTSAQVFIDPKEIVNTIESFKSGIIGTCSAAFRNSLFMFMMGCLLTSIAVLIYLSCTICILRPGRPRRIMRPSFWSRTDPRLAPGFRKAIVPLPDCFANARMLDSTPA